jgi:hypothetical protein
MQHTRYPNVLPVICIDARHAKAALKMQINKSDRNDFGLPSFCIGCGSKAANSSGHQRRLINLHSRTKPNSRRPAGINVPAGTLALVRSPLALRCSREQNALHTLIRQRHLTPSCGGQVPTAERTLDPARMLRESLNRGPELENSQGQTRSFSDVGSMSGLPESGHGWAIYEYTPFCNGPGDVKSPRVMVAAAELTLLSVVDAEAATLCCQRER